MRGEAPRFGRVLTAMVTPFDATGRVDHDRLAKVARYLLDNGSDGLIVNGTTGESPTTSPEEKVACLRTVISAVGGDRVIAGAGGNDTREVVHLAKMSSEAGSRALLTVAPYYNKPSQEGLYRHFRAIADATPLLVLLYNVPGRTITNIEPVTAARLGRDAATIVGIKEASSDMIHVGELFRQTPEEFDVYCGDDGILLQHLALGGAGVISVTSHVAGPDIAAIYRAWFAREPGEAARIFLRTLPITRALFSAPSPAPTKYALAWRGLPVGGVRLPLVDLTELEQRVVETALREYGLTPHSPG